MLLAAYRKVDATDADGWVATIVAIFTTYPEAVVRRVTDPRTGLARRSQYVPSAFEVTQACDAEMAPVRDHAKREAERARTDAICGRGPVEENAERRKHVADEIRGKLAGLWKAPDDKALLDPRGLPEGPARREVEANLAEHLRGLAADIRANPPQMSAALRASLGIARKDAAA